MSLTLRVRRNKYHHLKPSEQQNTSGQRRARRVVWTDISEILTLPPPPDIPVVWQDILRDQPETTMHVSWLKNPT